MSVTKSEVGKLFSDGKGKDVSYEQAKLLANHEDAEVRRELARQTEVSPEILYYLTDDPSVDVRAELAKNATTPPQADLLLAKDDSDAVRGDLAAKISRLAPGLSANQKDHIKAMAYEVLELLARDQVARVRRIISETLQDVADAPPEIIRQLAWDAEVLVSGPVLEFSPILTDDDLIEIIRRGSAAGRLNPIARRRDVSELVVDAIVETSDEAAVGLLLANASAQIREETLDRIIDDAMHVESWHAPLVVRPALTGSAACKLAKFVADNLLRTLNFRQDFTPDILEKIRAVVNERIEQGTASPGVLKEVEAKTPLEVAVDDALKQKASGQLTEQVLLDAVKGGLREQAVASLAVLTETPVISMERAVRQKDAKGMVAIAWRAGLSAQALEPLQSELAGIDEAGMLLPTEDGKYPLSDSDLEWQFEAITNLN